MEKHLKEQLEQFYAQGKEHDSKQTDRLKRWRNIEPESALLITLLIKTKCAQNVLEIGTSNGYSTIKIADALRSTGGQLTTIEIEKERVAEAQKNLEEYKLSDYVECLHADAFDFLQTNKRYFDFILLDAERKEYVRYWPFLKNLLSANRKCLMVVDNVVSHANEVADFVSEIEKDETFKIIKIPVGAGLLFVGLDY